MPTKRNTWRNRAAAALAIGLLGAGGAYTTAGAVVYAQAAAAQALLERAFDEAVRTGATVRPWPGADTEVEARITVPRLGVSRIVLATDQGQSLSYGPGHVLGTAVAGDPGLAVYAAHRDTHFDFLGRLRAGDRIEIERADGRRYAFEVTGSQVMRRDGLSFDPEAAEATLALATCWPLDGRVRGPMRYVVRARAVS